MVESSDHDMIFGKSPTDGVPPNSRDGITISLCLRQVPAETVRSEKRHPSAGVPRMRLCSSPPASPHSFAERLADYEEQCRDHDTLKTMSSRSKASRGPSEPPIPEDTPVAQSEQNTDLQGGCCCVIA
uniref:Uncharacterized protein n=1 Tax=Noctiluca scintillans TaxID=2966 RepID=A0A7S1F9M6_NOCSC|mmetsp:Transcript_43592/g.115115  ORF Transcript_43592/g.115115 Transcript_43592/m.115115 type:complete len:128 (+) Transcript_43592:79-462(+)